MPVARKIVVATRKKSVARSPSARSAAGYKLLVRKLALKRRLAAKKRAAAPAAQAKPVVFNSPLEPAHTTRAAIAKTVSRFVS
jgi:hypothetical protein